MDIAILSLIIASVGLGFKRGFMVTFLHTAGWILSIVLSLVLHSAVAEILKERTGYYQTLQAGMAERFSEAGTEAAGDALSGFPAVLSEAVNTAIGTLGESLAETVANLLFSIISFLIVIIAIKLIFFLLVFLFSKERNDGITGFFDSVMGAFFGAVKGIILVLILLAVLVPVMEITESQILANALEDSMIANLLYEGNAVFLAL